jgi:hypothetical protein
MVLLTLVDGKKGPGDTLVLVTVYNEPLSFAEWLFIGKQYLDSEASYYPIEKGYLGRAMLLNALNELACGVPLNRVLDRYGLKGRKNLNIIDKRAIHVDWDEPPLKRRLQNLEGRIR